MLMEVLLHEAHMLRFVSPGMAHGTIPAQSAKCRNISRLGNDLPGHSVHVLLKYPPTGGYAKNPCASRVPRAALPESWGAMSGLATAGAGGCAMLPSPMRSVVRWTGQSKPMTSLTRLATRAKPSRAGKRRRSVFPRRNACTIWESGCS